MYFLSTCVLATPRTGYPTHLPHASHASFYALFEPRPLLTSSGLVTSGQTTCHPQNFILSVLNVCLQRLVVLFSFVCSYKISGGLFCTLDL